MTRETENRLAAERCTPEQLAAEIKRIDNAVAKLGGPAGHKPGSAGHKLMLRRAAYQAEMLRRSDPVAEAVAAGYRPGRYTGDQPRLIAESR